jgi:hypothetical protein
MQFWKQQTGQLPQELMFDSQLTTYANLNRLDEQGVRFFTLRRRTRQQLSEIYPNATAKVRFESLLDVTGTVQINDTQVTVTLDKRAHNPYLVDSGLADQPTPMPWLEDKNLVVEFA